MNFKANSGIWGTMFGVPCIVADNFLKLATGEQLKVLLYILRCSGRSCTDEEIALNTGVSPQQAADAVMFWQQVNVLSPDSAAAENSNIMFAPPVSVNPNTAAPQKQSATPQEDKATALPRRKQNMTPSEISKMMKDSADISELFKTAEGCLGTLTHTQQNSLIWMYTYLGLKKEVIITLLAYCVSIEKTNVSYIEKVACEWSENEINTLSAAQDRVSIMSEAREFSAKIKKTFNMSRQPTANEREIIALWKQNGYSFELIQYAYELTIERIDKISFKYINVILENWKNNGYTTVKHVKEAESDYRKKKKSGAKSGSDDDFDVDKYKSLFNIF